MPSPRHRRGLCARFWEAAGLTNTRGSFNNSSILSVSLPGVLLLSGCTANSPHCNSRQGCPPLHLDLKVRKIACWGLFRDFGPVFDILFQPAAVFSQACCRNDGARALISGTCDLERGEDLALPRSARLNPRRSNIRRSPRGRFEHAMVKRRTLRLPALAKVRIPRFMPLG